MEWKNQSSIKVEGFKISPMFIDHIALWVNDLEVSRNFYVRYFNAQSGALYTNLKKNFKSYFLSFASGSRLELMHRLDISHTLEKGQEVMGLTHFAISVGSKDRVGELTSELRKAGISVVGEPRTTGDGYYESVVLDPEGNRIEITI